METVFLIQIINTDDCTYSIPETVAVCTDDINAIECQEKAIEVFSDRYIKSEDVRIVEVNLNQIIF